MIDYPSLSEAQVRNLLGVSGQTLGVIGALEPTLTYFTNQTDVTISHAFQTPFLTVTIFIENGTGVWNELPRTSYYYESEDDEITVHFDASTSGVIKLAY